MTIRTWTPRKAHAQAWPDRGADTTKKVRLVESLLKKRKTVKEVAEITGYAVPELRWFMQKFGLVSISKRGPKPKKSLTVQQVKERLLKKSAPKA